MFKFAVLSKVFYWIQIGYDYDVKWQDVLRSQQCLSQTPKMISLYIWCSQQIFSPKKVKEVQGVPQSQVTALPRHQEEEGTDKTKQVQIEQTYEKH